MIRIDEIYYNVFATALQHRQRVGLHWFDPFGSTSCRDLCNFPAIHGDAELRLLMWDQEPLHQDRVAAVLDEFLPVYKGPVRMVTSEHESESAQWIMDTYNISCDYYFFHAWAALDWYRGYDRTFLIRPYRQRKLTHTFLCANNIIGGTRLHRMNLLSELDRHELLETNLISFPSVCPFEKKTAAELAEAHGINIPHTKLPLQIDSGPDFSQHSSKIDLWSWAATCMVNIVTETLYQGRRHHLTEKTFKAMVMEQPFLLVSCQGSLEYLRYYGFQTFGDFWDESYDLADDTDRVALVAQVVRDLENMTSIEKRHLQKHISLVTEHNKSWFYSQEFEQKLWDELTKMVSKW